MKEGDIIEWRGVNKTIRGKVIKSDTDSADTWSSWTMVAPFLSRLSGGQGQQN